MLKKIGIAVFVIVLLFLAFAAFDGICIRGGKC